MHLTSDFFRAYKDMLTEIWMKLSVYLPLTCSLLQNILSTLAMSLLTAKWFSCEMEDLQYYVCVKPAERYLPLKKKKKQPKIQQRN